MASLEALIRSRLDEEGPEWLESLMRSRGDRGPAADPVESRRRGRPQRRTRRPVRWSPNPSPPRLPTLPGHSDGGSSGAAARSLSPAVPPAGARAVGTRSGPAAGTHGGGPVAVARPQTTSRAGKNAGVAAAGPRGVRESPGTSSSSPGRISGSQRGPYPTGRQRKGRSIHSRPGAGEHSPARESTSSGMIVIPGGVVNAADGPPPEVLAFGTLPTPADPCKSSHEGDPGLGARCLSLGAGPSAATGVPVLQVTAGGPSRGGARPADPASRDSSVRRVEQARVRPPRVGPTPPNTCSEYISTGRTSRQERRAEFHAHGADRRSGARHYERGDKRSCRSSESSSPGSRCSISGRGYVVPGSHKRRHNQEQRRSDRTSGNTSHRSSVICTPAPPAPTAMDPPSGELRSDNPALTACHNKSEMLNLLKGWIGQLECSVPKTQTLSGGNPMESPGVIFRDSLFCGVAPLGANVSPEIKGKIVRGEFVDVWALLSPEQDTVDKERSYERVERKPKVAKSFGNWLQAMLIFAHITCQEQPFLSVKLLVYLDTIFGAYKLYGGSAWWKYDEEFRRRIATNANISWDSKAMDLWIRLIMAQRPQRPFLGVQGTGGQPPGAPVSRNTGACWLYNDGHCRFLATCKFKHECSNCGGSHPAVRCSRRARPTTRQFVGTGENPGERPHASALAKIIPKEAGSKAAQ